MEMYQDLTKISDLELCELLRSTEREVSKFNNLQQAQKILLNGGYGSLSNEHNRWYSDDIAESITLSGQLSARWIIEHVNKFFNRLYQTDNVDYVIACDTDSIHLNIQTAMNKAFGDVIPAHEDKMIFLENFAKKIEAEIKTGYDLLAEEMNVFESAMHMKLETISRAVWTGKKHYVMEVWANEGIRYDPPKLKVVGLESVKSSTPKMIREWMRDAYIPILNHDADLLANMLDERREQYFKLHFDQIAFPRGITDIDKYYDPVTIFKKKCPIHVRGALLYNLIVKKMNLTDQLPLIQNGDKIRYCYLEQPNPTHFDVIAVPDSLPAQLGLDSFINHRLQYSKSFSDPIDKLIKIAGIRITNDIDIDSFFGIETDNKNAIEGYEDYQENDEEEDF